MSDEMPFRVQDENRIPHYHGDAVRGSFVIAAGLIFLAELLGGNLPFSTFLAVVMVVVLVIAAGITNPVQKWIHWVNVFLSISGLIIFGGIALARFKNDAPFSESFIIACIAAVFLVALYLATRTIRGFMLHTIRI